MMLDYRIHLRCPSRLVSFDIKGKSVYPTWSVQRADATSQALKKSSFVLHLPPLISTRQQNCQPLRPSGVDGNIEISTPHTNSVKHNTNRALDYRITLECAL